MFGKLFGGFAVAALGVGIVSLFSLTGCGGYGNETAMAAQGGEAQAVCPVTGDPINRQYYVKHEGKKIYACCPGCLPKIRAHPEKYAKMLRGKGVHLEKADR